MVAVYNVEDAFEQNPKTLGDWVKNFRMKKIQMKRKLRSSGSNLRVCAILSTALNSAELELRRKQQERFQKWLDFQTKINKNYEFLQPSSELHHRRPHHIKAKDKGDDDDQGITLIANRHYNHNEEESCKQNEEIDKLWKCELSDLDNFMRSISSNYKKNCNTKNCGNFQKNLVQTPQQLEVTS